MQVTAVPKGVKEADLADFFSTWGNVVLTTIVRRTERLRNARAMLAKLKPPAEGDTPTCCRGCPKPKCMRRSPRDEYQAALASYNKMCVLTVPVMRGVVGGARGRWVGRGS